MVGFGAITDEIYHGMTAWRLAARAQPFLFDPAPDHATDAT